jgi:hypothetical protein
VNEEERVILKAEQDRHAAEVLDEIIKLAKTEHLARTGLLGPRVLQVLREHEML